MVTECWLTHYWPITDFHWVNIDDISYCVFSLIFMYSYWLINFHLLTDDRMMINLLVILTEQWIIYWLSDLLIVLLTITHGHWLTLADW